MQESFTIFFMKWLPVLLLVASCLDGCRKPVKNQQGPAAASTEAAESAEKLRLQPLPPSDGEASVTCPVCGLKLRKEEADITLDYKATTYHFCTPDHREAFKQDPEMYLNIDSEDEK
jgi:YHS domain-containing protein